MGKNEEITVTMQADTQHRRMKPFRELNLLDDFMFHAAVDNLECCKIILELSLGIRIKHIQWKENQKVIHNLPDKRGIRLDFYVEIEDGEIIDVEMQKRNRGNIPKRTRFYQSLIDAPLLKSGEESFDGLKPSCIMIICGFDLYGLGKYRYTFTNQCKEVPDLELGDESTKIILNTRGRNEAEVERPLVDFLRYVESSRAENIPEDCDERLKRLHEVIESIKENSEMEAAYVKAETREREIIADAKQEGKREGKELINLLNQRLIEDGRMEELALSVSDRELQDRLLAEYGLQ